MPLAIDDFGTGYSSLASLPRLPVHELKIDKSFVARMADNHHDLVIVRSTIDLAHNLGLAWSPRGSRSGAADRLQALGCDLAQGFFVSHPLPIDRLTSWFGEAPWRLPPLERRSAPPPEDVAAAS